MSAMLIGCGGDGGGGTGDRETMFVDGGTLVNVDTVACDDDVDCDNGVFCDGEETCEQGVCLGGQRVVCDDGVDCTVDRCSEEIAGCLSEAPDLDADGHEDGLCLDADGEPLGDDCDDTDRSRFPGNIEICDDEGHDEDCNLTTFGERDMDLDGFDDAMCCNREGDVANCGLDCNDMLRGQHPDSVEICDGFDNDCDGTSDENLTITGYVDADRDRYGAGDLVEFCMGAPGFSEQAGDCDDLNRQVSPGLNELCSDGLDNDCDGNVDDAVVPSDWYRDVDGDGFGDARGGTRTSCEIQPGFALYPADCNDASALTFPGADEVCDGFDNDCNGSADFIVGPGNREDDDGDGAADFLCGLWRSDCDDSAGAVYPGAPELCDGVDNDCNGVIDGLVDEASWYVDSDNDGYGDDSLAPIVSCEFMADRVTQGGDCDDTKVDVHEGQIDGCNMTSGQDDDCDGRVDEDAIVAAFYFDPDGDGYGSGPAQLACVAPADYADRAGDCEESNAARYPGADENCATPDGIDNDCDLLVDCADPDCWGGNDCDNQGALTVTLPASYSRVVTREIAVTISLRDDANDPVAGSTVALTASPGAIFDTADAVTDVNGEIVGRIRLGPQPGAQIFTAATPGVRSQSVNIVAQAPADGTITTVVNANRKVSAPLAVDGAPSIENAVYRAFDMDLAADGTMYMTDSYAFVLRVTPRGVLQRVGGVGSGGNTGDLGDALSARISTPRGIALDEDGARLFVSASDRVRVISFATGKIDTVVGATGLSIPDTLELTDAGELLILESGSAPILSVMDPDSGLLRTLLARDCAAPVGIYTCGSYRCNLALTPDQQGIYITGNLCGSSIATTYGVAYAPLQTDAQGHITGIGPLQMVAGVAGGVPVASLAPDERLGAESTTIGTSLSGIAVDSSGALLVSSSSGDQVVRIDHDSGLIEHVAGLGAAPVAEGDFFPASDATFDVPMGMHFDADGNLLVTDFARGSLRKIWGVDRQVSDAVELAVTAGGGQSLYANQPIAPLAFTMTQDGAPGAGRRLHFEMTPSAGALTTAATITNSQGTAFTDGYVGLLPGDYTVTASVLDIRGDVVVQDTVTVGAVEPEVGMVYPVVNTSYAAKGPTNGVAAPVARPDRIFWGLAAADDGRVFFGGINQYTIHEVGTDGVVRRIAGTGGQAAISTSGPSAEDGQPALDYPMRNVSFLALDDANQLLYMLSDGPRIRVLDLVTGIIDHFYDMSPHGAIRAMGTDGSGGVLLVDATNFEVVRIASDGSLDVAGSYPLNEPGGSCADTLRLLSCGVPGGGVLEDKMCATTFFPDGSLVITARFCGSDVNYGNAAWGPATVARRLADGTWERLAGIHNGNAFVEGIDGLALTIGTSGSYSDLGTVAVDGRGWVFYTRNYYDNLVRGIAPDGRVYSVFGTGAVGPSGDYGPAVDAGGGVTGNTIGQMTIDADGNLLIAADATIRRVVLPAN